MQHHCAPKAQPDPTTQCPGWHEGSGTFVSLSLKASLPFLGKNQELQGTENQQAPEQPHSNTTSSAAGTGNILCSQHFQDVSFPEGDEEQRGERKVSGTGTAHAIHGNGHGMVHSHPQASVREEKGGTVTKTQQI